LAGAPFGGRHQDGGFLFRGSFKVVARSITVSASSRRLRGARPGSPGLLCHGTKLAVVGFLAVGVAGNNHAFLFIRHGLGVVRRRSGWCRRLSSAGLRFDRVVVVATISFQLCQPCLISSRRAWRSASRRADVAGLIQVRVSSTIVSSILSRAVSSWPAVFHILLRPAFGAAASRLNLGAVQGLAGPDRRPGVQGQPARVFCLKMWRRAFLLSRQKRQSDCDRAGSGRSARAARDVRGRRSPVCGSNDPVVVAVKPDFQEQARMVGRTALLPPRGIAKPKVDRSSCSTNSRRNAPGDRQVPSLRARVERENCWP